MYVYVLFPYYLWKIFKETGKVSFFDECNKDMLIWLREQMNKRGCLINNTDTPIYAYSEKPPLWYYPRRRVVRNLGHRRCGRAVPYKPPYECSRDFIKLLQGVPGLFLK